jgi:hypothetical protein
MEIICFVNCLSRSKGVVADMVWVFIALGLI